MISYLDVLKMQAAWLQMMTGGSMMPSTLGITPEPEDDEVQFKPAVCAPGGKPQTASEDRWMTRREAEHAAKARATEQPDAVHGVLSSDNQFTVLHAGALAAVDASKPTTIRAPRGRPDWKPRIVS